ncbi:MAG: DUF1015 family protein, partial [Phycisphaerales bacterium]|nr:DUF1015 family protein [Phycisphaerales bacterium]
MPAVFPFQALQYQDGSGDVSSLVAPPYDVLGLEARDALRARDARNVVTVDLPHVPAKELGPPEAYSTAASTFRSWIDQGVLTKRQAPAMFAYRQTFEFMGTPYRRHGMAATVETVPFGPRDGGGVLPHEQTFSGPKEDRFALMKATAAQLSPIFGLHADEQGQATRLLQKIM